MNFEAYEKLKKRLESNISFMGLQLFILITVGLIILTNIQDFNISIWEILAYNVHLFINVLSFGIILDIIFSLIWVYLRRFPKFKIKEIGILFCIVTDNEAEKIKIKKDFVEQIETILKKQDQRIKTYFLSEYRSQKIIKDPRYYFLKYHQKTNAKLILFGYARTRVHQGKSHYYLELNESVTHKTLINNEQNSIAQEMYSVFPRTSMIDYDEEFTGFKLNSFLFSYGSLYILALACYFSQENELALQLLDKLLTLNVNVKGNELLENKYRRIKENVIQIKIQLIYRLAYDLYKNKKDFNRLDFYINEAKKMKCKNYGMLLLEAIYLFEMDRINDALQVIEEAKEVSGSDHTWMMNKAFLKSVNGDLQDAYELYKQVFRKEIGKNVHLQCEEHIAETLRKRPDLYQLYYCRGLIYYFMREDFCLANEDFQKFIDEESRYGKFKHFLKHAENYIEKGNGWKNP